MQVFDAIERAISEIMVRAPHLSDKFREKMAQNLWWIVAVTSGLAAIYAVYLTIGAVFWSFDFGSVLGFSTLFVIAIFTAFISAVGAMSVRLLRVMKPQGWRGVFVMWVFFVVILTVVLASNFSRFNLMWDAFYALFVLYAIYETREFFFAKPKKIRKKK